VCVAVFDCLFWVWGAFLLSTRAILRLSTGDPNVVGYDVI